MQTTSQRLPAWQAIVVPIEVPTQPADRQRDVCDCLYWMMGGTPQHRQRQLIQSRLVGRTLGLMAYLLAQPNEA